MLYPTWFLVFLSGEELSLFVSNGGISAAISAAISTDQFSDFIDIPLLSLFAASSASFASSSIYALLSVRIFSSLDMPVGFCVRRSIFLSESG